MPTTPAVAVKLCRLDSAKVPVAWASVAVMCAPWSVEVIDPTPAPSETLVPVPDSVLVALLARAFACCRPFVTLAVVFVSVLATEMMMPVAGVAGAPPSEKPGTPPPVEPVPKYGVPTVPKIPTPD